MTFRLSQLLKDNETLTPTTYSEVIDLIEAQNIKKLLYFNSPLMYNSEWCLVYSYKIY